jgi:hypothetical protein
MFEINRIQLPANDNYVIALRDARKNVVSPCLPFALPLNLVSEVLEILSVAFNLQDVDIPRTMANSCP